MGIKIDLWSDLEDILDKRLKEMKIQRKEYQDPVMDYLRLEQRLIEPKPREIKKAKDFICPNGYEEELKYIKDCISQGKDLHPFMSRNIKQMRNEDKLLSDWGIYHLHLSKQMDNDGFMSRSDYLLMVRIDEGMVYFLKIVSHKKKNVFVLKEYIQIIHDNWADTIKKYRMQGVENIQEITDDGRKALRNINIQTCVTVEDGTIYRPLGGGYMSDGTSFVAVQRYLAWKKSIEDIQKWMINNFDMWCNIAFKDTLGVVKQKDIILVLFLNDMLVLQEKTTQLCIKIKRIKGKGWSVKILSKANVFNEEWNQCGWRI